MKDFFKDHEPGISALLAFIFSGIIWLIQPQEFIPSYLLIIMSAITLLMFYCFMRERYLLTKPMQNPNFKATIHDCSEKGKLVFTVNIQSVLSQGSYFLIAELSNETETIVAWGIIDSVNTKGLYQAKYNMFDQDPHKLTKENLIIRPSLTERSLSLMQNAKFPK